VALPLDLDPYALRADAHEAPPGSIGRALRRVGPGMVLAASIVGSGELIATTTLGAQVGYAALWLIVVSCAVKPVVQAEMGRYSIATGETTLEGFNRMPGPRAGVSWLVWAWLLMVALVQLQVGGMFGGVAQVMNQVVPSVSANAWVAVFLVLTIVLLLGGGYDRIEKLSLIKVALFTVLTVCAAIVLLGQPQYFSIRDALGGLKPSLFGGQREGLATAVAVFGITGVGATELVMYPYWCIEKGYARCVGRPDGSASWRERARGWIRVMHLDILCSLVIYTIATIAFYLLGAGILHGMGLVPAARDMIPVLSNIYTRTLGEWALWAFYLGAIITLYGTIFASTAAHARLLSDFCRLLGVFPRTDYVQRLYWQRIFVVVLVAIPAMLYWLVASPVAMVVAGGTAQALMLPLIGIAITYLRHRQLPQAVAPGALTTTALWISTIVMTVATTFTVWLTYFR
jgi:manganese transport protein